MNTDVVRNYTTCITRIKLGNPFFDNEIAKELYQMGFLKKRMGSGRDISYFMPNDQEENFKMFIDALEKL